MSDSLAFEYSLTRRGSIVYFRVKEQGRQLYDDRLLSHINSFLSSKNITHTVRSCECPELAGSYIYLRGMDEELDDRGISIDCGSVEKAITTYKRYKKTLRLVTEFLSTYTDDSVLRKIRELQQRYKNKQFYSVSSPLPFPKDI